MVTKGTVTVKITALPIYSTIKIAPYYQCLILRFMSRINTVNLN